MYEIEKNMADNKIRYVYICSAARSGSTLMDLLIGSHSKISSLGEIEHLTKNISLNTLCTCGEKIQNCTLWKSVIDVLNKKRGINIYQSPYAFNMGLPNPSVVKDKIHETLRYKLKRKIIKGFQYIRLRYEAPCIDHLLGELLESFQNTFLVYDTVRSFLGCDIVVDSSKSYMNAIQLYKAKPDNVRVLVLQRDGRGVFYSNLKSGFPEKNSIRGWRNYYNRALPLFEKHIDADHIHCVKYENLVTNPEYELSRICDFLQVEFESSMLHFSDHLHHMTNGNNMRFKQSSAIKIDNAWVSKLTASQKYYFEKKCGALNRKLGYQ